MMRKTRPLPGRVRLLLLAVSGLLGVVSFAGLCFAYRQPVAASKTIALYRYQHKAEITYRVRIKPNSIYPGKVLAPGRIYFTKLAEGVDATLCYRFTAAEPAGFSGSYEVVATVEAPEMWRKEFLLIPATAVKGKGKTFGFRRDFTVDLARFQDFVTEAVKETGASPYEPRLVIRANVNLQAVTQYGTVQERLAPAMVIPLTAGTFKITGNLSPQENGALTKTVKVPLPAVKVARAGAAVATFFAGGLFLLLLVLTHSRPDATAAEREIRRRCGDRLVKAVDINLPPAAPTVHMGSAADFLRVTGELDKPVVCLPGPEGCTAYIIFDGATAYSYVPGTVRTQDSTPEG
ncbi:DUF5305 family protein [Thermodesulfitimonas autotrophica]|uniref:DUF5305 family protein n=1 Tax=Thermodesulfitimonas autotrophica TaxID=1894989 RepID=UPI002FE41E00